MFVPWAVINRHKTTTALFAQGTYRKSQRLVEEEARMGVATGFQAYDRPLETVTSFKYLGSFLTATYNALQAFIANL